jgi:hypothetical protein
MKAIDFNREYSFLSSVRFVLMVILMLAAILVSRPLCACMIHPWTAMHILRLNVHDCVISPVTVIVSCFELLSHIKRLSSVLPLKIPI